MQVTKEFFIKFSVIKKSTIVVFTFLSSSMFLCANSAYVQGKDPQMDRYYERNEQACLDNQSTKRYACFTAGEKYIYFNKDEMGKGVKYWEKSCKWREYGTACYFLAKVYLNEKNGVYHNQGKALESLKKGCELNEKNSIRLGCQEGIKVCCEKSLAN